MAPYRRTRSYRYSPYGAAAQVAMPVPQAVLPVSRASGYARSRYSGYSSRRSYGRYRSKWSAINSRTNPVYPRPEVKNLDYPLGNAATPASITDTGTPICINIITNGTSDGQRIGRSVATKSVYWNYVLNFGTGEVPNAIRHMLIWDRQSNGNAPATTDILQQTGTAQLITCPLNLDNKQRFVILADERLTLSPQGDQIRLCSGYRSINQKSTWDNDTLDNIPSTGSLLLLFLSDEATTENQPTFYGTWRMRFLDN